MLSPRIAIGALLGAIVCSVSYAAPITATISAEVKTDEVDDDIRFVNAQGSGNGDFASYGVLEFPTTALAGTTSVPGIKLTLTQANAFFTNDGGIDFYITQDDSTDITPGVSEIRADPTQAPGAIAATDFSDRVLLGSSTFTQTETGDLDMYSFDLSADLESYVLGQVASGGPLRIIFAASDPGTSATYAGVGNDPGPAPTMEVVPEPGSAVLLLMGMLALSFRRR